MQITYFKHYNKVDYLLNYQNDNDFYIVKTRAEAILHDTNARGMR